MKLVIVLSFLFAGAAVAIGVTGDELLLGIGTAGAFLFMLLITVINLRQKKLEKTKSNKDALAIGGTAPTRKI